jgi:hypothetical protein
MLTPPLRQGHNNKMHHPPHKTQPIPILATLARTQHRITMKFLLVIANAFINTMGITQPSPEAANRAAKFIVIMLVAVLAAVASVAIIAIHWTSHH